MEIEKNEETQEYIKEQTYKKVIEQYLFLQSLKYKLGDDYIKTMYRINPSKIRALYNAIPEEVRKRLEEETESKIDNGEIDLKQKAVKWHKESFKIEKEEEEGER